MTKQLKKAMNVHDRIHCNADGVSRLQEFNAEICNVEISGVYLNEDKGKINFENFDLVIDHQLGFISVLLTCFVFCFYLFFFQ